MCLTHPVAAAALLRRCRLKVIPKMTMGMTVGPGGVVRQSLTFISKEAYITMASKINRAMRPGQDVRARAARMPRAWARCSLQACLRVLADFSVPADDTPSFFPFVPSITCLQQATILAEAEEDWLEDSGGAKVMNECAVRRPNLSLFAAASVVIAYAGS